MTNLVTRLQVRFYSSKGQAMAEYALILAAIAVVTIAGYKLVGTNIQALISSIAGDL